MLSRVAKHISHYTVLHPSYSDFSLAHVLYCSLRITKSLKRSFGISVVHVLWSRASYREALNWLTALLISYFYLSYAHKSLYSSFDNFAFTHTVQCLADKNYHQISALSDTRPYCTEWRRPASDSSITFISLKDYCSNSAIVTARRRDRGRKTFSLVTLMPVYYMLLFACKTGHGTGSRLHNCSMTNDAY